MNASSQTLMSVAKCRGSWAVGVGKSRGYKKSFPKKVKLKKSKGKKL